MGAIRIMVGKPEEMKRPGRHGRKMDDITEMDQRKWDMRMCTGFI
jgi:hypothetical protein